MPAVMALLSACGQNKNASNDDSRLVSAPEVNKVEVIQLQRTTFHSQLSSNGKVSAAARTELAFRTQGVLTAVNARNGEHVRKGQLIAAIDATAQALALQSAKSAMDKANLDLQDVLIGQGYRPGDTVKVPDAVMKMARIRSGYDAAEIALRKAQYELDGCSLTAPFPGKIADLKLGKHASTSSDPFCTLIDDSTMDATFSVMESEYHLLQKGLKVQVEPFAGEGRRLAGVITAINPAVDRNGQISVTASVRNDGTLVDGMNVRVLVEKDIPGQLVVPRSAVVIRDNMNVLFRYSGGKAQWTYVNILHSSGDCYSVEANADRAAELAPGDTVIVSGNLNLADGSQVIPAK